MFTLQGYNVRSQTRSTWSTSSASCLHPHYSNVSYTYNKSIHISSYHKINHPSSGTNGVCKRTPFSSSYSGRGVRILKHQKSLRCRFQICASLDVASAVDVINDLGLDTLTFLAVTVLIVPAFKTIKASPVSWMHYSSPSSLFASCYNWLCVYVSTDKYFFMKDFRFSNQVLLSFCYLILESKTELTTLVK